MRLDSLKNEVASWWDSVADGWRQLTRSAAGALTRFKPGEHADLPAREEIDDVTYLPSQRWAMLGGDVFEDDSRLVVRLEIPGLDKQDLDIEVRDDALVVSGEKRFSREATEGRWRVMQCAYGSFRRVVPLPAAVRPDAASARYADGVLRVELPKAEPGTPKGVRIAVE
jgi:HSP20 family protein